jgi:hypothetical protein
LRYLIDLVVRSQDWSKTNTGNSDAESNGTNNQPSIDKPISNTSIHPGKQGPFVDHLFSFKILNIKLQL